MGQISMSALIPIVVAALTIISGFVTWYLNERSKRSDERFKRKEEKYIGLVGSLRGFYMGAPGDELKEDFFKQLDLSWLYCSDEVIKRAYEFLNTVTVDTDQSAADSQQAIGRLLLAIRQDLGNREPLGETRLSPDIYCFFRVAQEQREALKNRR